VGTDFKLNNGQLMPDSLQLLFVTDIAADNNGHIWWLNTVSGPDEKPEMSLCKLMQNGNILSEFEFGDFEPAEGYAVRALPDGYYRCFLHGIARQ
jgi:hypothetical protein